MKDLTQAFSDLTWLKKSIWEYQLMFIANKNDAGRCPRPPPRALLLIGSFSFIHELKQLFRFLPRISAENPIHRSCSFPVTASAHACDLSPTQFWVLEFLVFWCREFLSSRTDELRFADVHLCCLSPSWLCP